MRSRKNKIKSKEVKCNNKCWPSKFVNKKEKKFLLKKTRKTLAKIKCRLQNPAQTNVDKSFFCMYFFTYYCIFKIKVPSSKRR